MGITAQPDLSFVASAPRRTIVAGADECWLDVEATLEQAQAAVDAHRPDEALQLIDDVASLGSLAPRVRFRTLLVEAWARIAAGDPRTAERLLDQARWMADDAGGEVGRIEVLFRLGCARLRQAKVGNATALLTVAYEDAHRCDEATNDLRATILQWRARCWLRQNLTEAATQDVELALELAEAASGRVGADVNFQASIVAERRGEFLLARMYAESALEGYRALGDDVAVDKVLNNLGGIHVLLGDFDAAVASLTESLSVARGLNDVVGAGFALSTLAETHLRAGRPEAAESFARQAIAILEPMPTQATETGCALLTLGRAEATEGRFDAAAVDFRRAESCFHTAHALSHEAEAWIAQGDLAERRGELLAAIDRYRRAALALRNVHL